MCVAHSHLVSGIVQYHQVPDEYFTSAVVLSLILAALFGLVYLLIIPQYVQQVLFLFISLPLFISGNDSFSLTPPSFLLPLLLLRGTAVLVLLVFCICFLVACIMYLHITRVQVITASFFNPYSMLEIFFLLTHLIYVCTCVFEFPKHTGLKLCIFLLL